MASRRTTVLKVEAKAKGKNDKKRFKKAAKRLVRASNALAKGRITRQRRTKVKKNQGGGGGP